MATVAQFEEWAGLRDEILKVFNRRRRSLLKKIKKCPEDEIEQLGELTRTFELVDEYLDEFTTIVVGGRVKKLRAFKKKFFDRVLPPGDGSFEDRLAKLCPENDKAFLSDIEPFLSSCVVTTEATVADRFIPVLDDYEIKDDETNPPAPRYLPAHMVEGGYAYVAEHIRQSYLLNHLVERDAPSNTIYENTLKLVKAANNVHQISSSFGRVHIPKEWMPMMKIKRKPASAAAGTPSAPNKKPREDPGEGRTTRSQTVPTVARAPSHEGGERRSCRLAEKAQVAPLPTVIEVSNSSSPSSTSSDGSESEPEPFHGLPEAPGVCDDDDDDDDDGLPVPEPVDGKEQTDEDSGNDGTPGTNPCQVVEVVMQRPATPPPSASEQQEVGADEVRDGKGGRGRRAPKKIPQADEVATGDVHDGNRRKTPGERKKSGLPFELTDERLKLEFFRRAVEGLPDSVPPFTAADVENTEEAVLKFQKNVIVRLKPLLKTQIELYETDRVDNYYDGKFGTLLQTKPDARTHEVDKFSWRHILLKPRKLTEPNTEDNTNPREQWDGKTIDCDKLPEQQVGRQKYPTAGKDEFVEYVMVAQGGSGLHYPFTLETFKYMVVVLNRHFETLLDFLKQKCCVPDQQHHAKGELAPASYSFPLVHILSLFFPGETLELVKSPIGFKHYRRPRFVQDRLDAFTSFYPKLYNAVLSMYLRRKRKGKLPPREQGWLNQHFQKLDEKKVKDLLSRRVYYELGEMARKADFARFLQRKPTTDESRWLKDVFFGRATYFRWGEEKRKQNRSMLHEAGYMIGPNEGDLMRLKEELTKEFQEREQNGSPAGTSKRTPSAVLSSPQPPQPTTTEPSTPADTTTTRDRPSQDDTGGGSQFYGDGEDDSDFLASPQHQRNQNTKSPKRKKQQGDSEKNKEKDRNAAEDPGPSSSRTGFGATTSKRNPIRNAAMKKNYYVQLYHDDDVPTPNPRPAPTNAKVSGKGGSTAGKGKSTKNNEEEELRKKKEEEELRKKDEEEELRKKKEEKKKKEKAAKKKRKGAQSDTDEDEASEGDEDDVPQRFKSYVDRNNKKILKEMKGMFEAFAGRLVNAPSGPPCAADSSSAEDDEGPKSKKPKTDNKRKKK